MKRISYYILLIIITGSSAFSQVLTIPLGTAVQTTAPDGEVHVNGYTKLLNPDGRVLEITRDNNDAFLTFHDPGDAWYSMGIDRSDGFKFKLNYGGDLFAENQFTLTNDGKFGFGTNSPTAKIETGLIPVNDPAFKTMDFQIVPDLSGGGWNNISQASDIGLIFKTGKSLVIAPHAPSLSGLRITATGDVGIGTSSPEGLQVSLPLSGETSRAEDNVRIGVLGNTPRIILDDAGHTPFQIDNAAGRFRIFTPGVERFTVTANGNVGIGGVITPTAKLDIEEPAIETAAVRISNILIVPNLINGSYNGISRDGDAGIILTNNQSFVIAPHKNATSGLRVNSNGNVGIGTSNPTQKLTVNGTVYSTEVKVDVNAGTGPDYVFEPTYQLPSLTEIENYIKANKHLPEVPSAKEMETNGINLSEMNMLLLKKVEELTLYLIEVQKNNIDQQKQLAEQSKEIEFLKLKIK